MPLCGIRVPALAAAALALAVVSLPAAQEPQRPSFRTGTNVVRVDAYPTAKDGRIIQGLKAEDFEVFEDGVRQTISSFEFVEFPQSNPIEARRDPNSQREGFQLAADPNYRVFVIYLDNLHVSFTGSHNVRVPLITFLNRVLGPKDLFGVITTAQSARDLMLGQKTDFIEEQLTKYWDWGSGGRALRDDVDMVLEVCGLGAFIPHRQTLEVIHDLEGVITTLAAVREERKNIVLVSDGWLLPPRIGGTTAVGRPMMPTPGVTDAGKITLGNRRKGEVSPKMCEDLRAEYADVDVRRKMQDLIALADESNVTFYAIRPSGLVAAATAMGQDIDRQKVDSLRVLADNTAGVAVVNTNDLTGGAERIARDLSAVYYLAYTPTNTKPDGRVRQITVRLKSTGDRIRARREYRAPTESEMAEMRKASAAAAAPPPPATATDVALSELKRLRPGAVLHTRGSVLGDELVIVSELTSPEVEAGRWKDGGDVQLTVAAAGGDILTTARGRVEPGQRAVVMRVPVQKQPGPFTAAIRLRNPTEGEAQDGVTVARAAGMLGEPLLYRMTTAANARPAGSVVFRRTERIQVRWPIAAPLEARQARLLGRDGVPLELQVALSDASEGGVAFAVATVNLAPLTAGEYILELTGTRGGQTGAAALAFRVGR